MLIAKGKTETPLIGIEEFGLKKPMQEAKKYFLNKPYLLTKIRNKVLQSYYKNTMGMNGK